MRLLRTISFIEALVSILTLQNTLLMINSKDGSAEMLTLSAVTSAAVMLTVLALSLATMIKGVGGLRSKNQAIQYFAQWVFYSAKRNWQVIYYTRAGVRRL